MTDQVVLQEAENRRAEFLAQALADGKGIKKALALAARAEAFVTGVITPEEILQTQPEPSPPPVPRDPRLAGIEIVDEPAAPAGARPLTDESLPVEPKPGEPVMTATEILERRQKPAATGKGLRWSVAEIAYLKQAWPADVPMAEIMARLEGRSENSIRVKSCSLDLKRSPEFRGAVCQKAVLSKTSLSKTSLSKTSLSKTSLPKRHEQGAKVDRLAHGSAADPATQGKSLESYGGPKSGGTQSTFERVMAEAVAWFAARGEPVVIEGGGAYLIDGEQFTARQLLAKANGVRVRLGAKPFVLPDPDALSGADHAAGASTAAAATAEAG